MDGLYIATAFVAGVVSFLAPCILPIIPGYLAYIAGSSDVESQTKRRDIFVNSIFFVLGFSFIFALLGVLLQTTLSHVGFQVQMWLSRIGGLIIIFFGLYLTGLLDISALNRMHTPRVNRDANRSRYFTSFLFGVAFAVGWTPCVGAVLGGILALAASAPLSAFALLFSYALGLGVPFLIVGLFTAQATHFIARFGRALSYANVIFGVILVGLGILVFTQDITLIGNLDFFNSFLLTR
jgi:cytochrome c-type biogenesis protein